MDAMPKKMAIPSKSSFGALKMDLSPAVNADQEPAKNGTKKRIRMFRSL